MWLLTKLFPPEVPEKEALAVQDPTVPPIDIPTDYAELAAMAGFKGFKILQAQEQKLAHQTRTIALFRNFLAENGICVYPADKVRKYLNRIKPWDTDVRWVGLNGGTLNGHFTDYTYWDQQVGYSKKIPKPVLITMAKIKEAFPNVSFWVSDFSVPDADPFLAAQIEGEFFIIERWDEPGFRM